MKYSINIHEFSFNKIKSGSRRIGVHLLDKKAQIVKLNDVLDLHNMSSKEHIECKVKGIAIFDNFNDLIDALGTQPLGYDNKEEILIRINRLFPQELQNTLNAVAFFLEPLSLPDRNISRDELER